MKMTLWQLTIGIAVTIAAINTVRADQLISFDHLNAGALGTNQGDKLVWANGAVFAASAGYYYGMNRATNGVYNGYYSSSPSLTALSATTLPAGLPPAWGSFIDVQITLLSAPAGGTFAYWTNTLGPTFSLNVGESTPLISLTDLSMGANDPFGHIHGRRFTATLPGDYLVDLRLFDVSTTGLNGGPHLSPSDEFIMDFRAIPEPSSLALAALGVCAIWLMRMPRKIAQPVPITRATKIIAR